MFQDIYKCEQLEATRKTIQGIPERARLEATDQANSSAKRVSENPGDAQELPELDIELITLVLPDESSQYLIYTYNCAAVVSCVISHVTRSYCGAFVFLILLSVSCLLFTLILESFSKEYIRIRIYDVSNFPWHLKKCLHCASLE